MPISRRVSPSASGPSDGVVHRDQRGGQGRPGRPPSATRVVARQPVRSVRRPDRRPAGPRSPSTACTSDPNAAPAGSSAIGETGRFRRRGGAASAGDIGRIGRFVILAGRLRLAGDTRVYRRPGSVPSTTCGASRCRSCGGSAGHRDQLAQTDIRWSAPVRTTDSSTTGPPAACQSPKMRSASASLMVAGLQRPGTSRSPIPRPRSNRDRPPLGSSQAGAHHATTWDCARVSAT